MPLALLSKEQQEGEGFTREGNPGAKGEHSTGKDLPDREHLKKESSSQSPTRSPLMGRQIHSD